MVSKKRGALLVKHFRTDHYTAIFNPRSGFFARVEDDGQPEPFWAEHGPELLDISVTNWCDRGCTFCYRKSDTNGSHMAIDDFEEILRQAAEMHVFEWALRRWKSKPAPAIRRDATHGARQIRNSPELYILMDAALATPFWKLPRGIAAQLP